MAATNTMTWVEEVDIALVGGDLKTEPWETMKKWYFKNRKAIEEASLTA
jgi:hypothetical protein